MLFMARTLWASGVLYAVAILLLALTMPARAEDTKSANYVLWGCKALLAGGEPTVGEAWSRGHCVGFIAGLVYGTGGGTLVCQPEGVTIGQALAVVIKYIEARPQRMHEPFGVLAVEAMREAWPCKR
jgi:hypothetical protein